MKRLLCLIGIHKFSKWLPSHYNAKFDYRYCHRCFKREDRRAVG
jgi:hypothetical protein